MDSAILMETFILTDICKRDISLVVELWFCGRCITDVYIDGDWFTVDEFTIDISESDKG